MKHAWCAFLLTLLLLLPLMASADDLQEIKSQGTISFAMSGQYPPFNFVDENNQLSGFDVEICSALAELIGVEPEPLSTAWDGIIAGLLTNRFDLICGSMAITDERLKSIDFTDPYYRSGAQLFVKKGSDLQSATDLKDKKIGVTLGTTYEEWVRTNLPGADVRTYKGVPDMLLEVMNNRIDGFISDRIVGAMAIDEKGVPIQMAGSLLYEERMGIALRQDNPQLKKALNDALTTIKDNGTYREISLKWLKVDAR